MGIDTATLKCRGYVLSASGTQLALGEEKNLRSAADYLCTHFSCPNLRARTCIYHKLGRVFTE